jgi:integrase
MLVNSDQHKQALGQARAAIITLADLLAEAGWLDDYAVASLSRVRVPRAEEGQRPGKWLSIEEIHAMLQASRSIANHETQVQRNVLIMTMLCTLALRREELCVAKWSDISAQNNRPVLRVHGKGRKTATIDLPRSVMSAMESWRKISTPDRNSPIIRRIWKGGKIAKTGLSTDGIWRVVGDCALSAGIDHVAPHDLRRSVAGALFNAGVPIEKISQLLRHSNIAITERYLNKLPKENLGGVLMSDLLGWEEGDWGDGEN